METFTLTVEIPVTITQDDILNNIGFSRACQYWGDVQYAGNGVYIVEPHDEQGRKVEVTINELRTGFALAFKNRDNYGNTIIGDDTLHGYFLSAVAYRDAKDNIDWGDIDDYAADAWMQIAIWGHLVYG